MKKSGLNSINLAIKILIAIGLILLIFDNNLFAQNEYINRFTLQGNVIGRDTGSIVLSYSNENGEQIIDTTYLKNGHFSFKGSITEPTLASLIGKVKIPSREDPDFTQIFLEPKRMTISIVEGKYKKAEMTGSYSQKQWDTLKQRLAPILKELQPMDIQYTKLKVSYANGDSSKRIKNRLKMQRAKILPYLDLIDKTFYGFVHSHPNSFVSAYILSEFVNISKLPADSAKKYYTGLNPKIRNSKPGRLLYKELLSQKIFSASKSYPGNKAPLFTLPGLKGKSISLLSFRGKKYVLLDFWASWCIPCRQSIPKLKQIYQRYHDKGLEIISLSWDYNKKDWKMALKRDSTYNWYNIYLDISNQNNYVSEKYGVSGIPKFILIDKNGTIIGRYNWENNLIELDKKLNEIFM